MGPLSVVKGGAGHHSYEDEASGQLAGGHVTAWSALLAAAWASSGSAQRNQRLAIVLLAILLGPVEEMVWKVEEGVNSQETIKLTDSQLCK